MTKQVTKKLFAFIIVIMMFSFFTEFAKGQNKKPPPATGYACNCGVHGYGCQGNHQCINYCTMRCEYVAVKITDDKITFPDKKLDLKSNISAVSKLEWNTLDEKEMQKELNATAKLTH